MSVSADQPSETNDAQARAHTAHDRVSRAVPAKSLRWRGAWLVAAATSVSCSDNSSQINERQIATDQVVANCVQAMLRSTCNVMNGPAADQTASVVFVAGVGPVDASAYRELRASGEAMCQVVRSACEKNWDAAQCKTARGLWPPPEVDGREAR